MQVSLAAWMEAEGVNIAQLAARAGVAWRTARDARAGRLRSASKARRIADACGRADSGEYVVDPASMLDVRATGEAA